ncbi:MAG: N4-gp56 family major capsid protein [Oscillibacter sp.]|nr:N4-gp56 family major capsid protein [Oscillibacter sp.]MBR1689222.1 N4-gp56 family major capsid protein [Oscillibacter sp.]
MNLASKYASKVDERFYRESQAALALNNDYQFSGVKTVNVYSVPTVPMRDYTRSGVSRYGVPEDLKNSVQELTVTKDRAFTFIIDKGDKTQSMMVMDAGKALARQLREVVVPEYDTYVFRTLAETAQKTGNTSAAAATKANAYELFLKGQEVLGDKNVPDTGRVCFCSYKFANLLKQDASFMRYGDAAQQMLSKGVVGEVDGCRIVKVPASRLPAGCAFLLTHPIAATAPKQLEEYKIHDNPPGISGWLVEGRILYDCFVLDEKADAVYYHGTALS